MSQASSSLTLREDELSSSTTTQRTVNMSKQKGKTVVQTMKRMLLSNKSGQGSVCVPAQSHDALFFQKIEPLIKGASFEIEMQSGKFSNKRVYLGINLI